MGKVSQGKEMPYHPDDQVTFRVGRKRHTSEANMLWSCEKHVGPAPSLGPNASQSPASCSAWTSYSVSLRFSLLGTEVEITAFLFLLWG